MAQKGLLVATIGDVAKEAGVARSTVSAVLTGKRFVSPETKARVQEAIDLLNFTVNSRARALATSKTMTLGLSLQFREGEFATALGTYIVAISQAAQQKKYRLLLLTDDDGTEAITRSMAEKSVDGFILMNVLENDPRISAIAERGFPAISIGVPENIKGMDAIDLDFSRAAALLVERAWNSGARRISLLGWPSEVYESGVTYAQNFRRSAIETCKSLGVDVECLELSMQPKTATKQLEELLPGIGADALIVHNDAVSALLPLALSHAGRQDLAVFGLHSSEVASTFQIPFEAVESEAESISLQAVDILVARLEDSDRPFSSLLVQPKITRLTP